MLRLEDSSFAVTRQRTLDAASRRGLRGLLEIQIDLYSRYKMPWMSRFPVGRAPQAAEETSGDTGRYLAFTTAYEGIGGQFSRYVTAKHLARHLGLTYVHHPFLRIFHAPHLDWEEFLGLGRGQVLLPHLLQRPGLEVVELPFIDTRFHTELQFTLLEHIIRHTHKGDGKLFLLTPWSFAPPPDGSPFQRHVFEEFASLYWQARSLNPMPSPFRQGAVSFAVIVRRGELRGMKAARGRIRRMALRRWVDNDWYVRVLERLALVLGGALDIRVFSDADHPDELGELSRLRNVTLHLKGESPHQPFQAFHAMTVADVLVCGLTGFCWPAGSLTKGIKIIPPRTHEIYFPHGPTWHEADTRGRFDPTVLATVPTEADQRALLGESVDA